MAQKKKPIKSWGVVLDGSIPHSADFYCENPQCGNWSYISNDEDRYKQIVGFVSNFEPIIIIECPECFEKFGFTAQIALKI